jgi:hypothetical protein
MTKKRYSPESLLQEVITVLETDDGARSGEPLSRKVLGAYARALEKLLTRGPLSWRSDPAAGIEGAQPPTSLADADQLLMMRAELLQLLRSTVRGAGVKRASSAIWTDKPMAFAVHLIDDDAQLMASGDIRDVLILQTLMLLHEVGLHNIRTCACGRLFVKTYRRTFCSTTCQKRYYMRQRRENDRRKRDRRRALRRKEQA